MRIKISLEFEKLDLDYDTRTQQEIIARYCYDFAANSVAKAKSVIKRISERYPIILVSNFYGNIESVLKDFGILEYFPVIIESAVVGVRKPNPKIFALGVEALGYPSENVLVVGDSYTKDIAPASSLGCQTIWIKGKGWDSKEDEIPHDHIITQFEQLYNFIEL